MTELTDKEAKVLASFVRVPGCAGAQRTVIDDRPAQDVDSDGVVDVGDQTTAQLLF